MSEIKSIPQLNQKETETFLHSFMINNYKLVTSTTLSDIRPTALNIVGISGIGKTSIIRQVARQYLLALRDVNPLAYEQIDPTRINDQIVKLSLAQMSEEGDLIGLSYKVYEAIDKENNTRWIPENALQTELMSSQERNDNGELEFTLKLTGQVKTETAPPSWIKGKSDFVVLILDDFNRANPQILQATMELINEGESLSWRLPSTAQIILSSNPDDDPDYMVTSMDEAMKSRMAIIEMIFDKSAWCQWAEINKLDSRVINFVHYYGELFSSKTKDSSIKVSRIAPRSYTKLATMLGVIKDWKESIVYISKLAGSLIGAPDSVRLLSFIEGGLDKLVPVDDLIKLSKDDMAKKLHSIVGGYVSNPDGSDNVKYKTTIAAIYTERFISYMINNIDTIAVDQAKNIASLFSNGSNPNMSLFSQSMTTSYTTRCNNLIDPKYASKLQKTNLTQGAALSLIDI